MDRQDFEAAVAAEVSKRLRMAAEVLRVKARIAPAMATPILECVAHALEEACAPAPSIKQKREILVRGLGEPRWQLTATQTAVATCASCGGKLGGCYYTRKTDGKQFCLACGDAGVPEEYHNHCAPHPDSPAPNPPHTTAAPQPPRSRCCNTDTFTAEGRVICSRCRLGCRTR